MVIEKMHNKSEKTNQKPAGGFDEAEISPAVEAFTAVWEQ